MTGRAAADRIRLAPGDPLDDEAFRERKIVSRRHRPPNIVLGDGPAEADRPQPRRRQRVAAAAEKSDGPANAIRDLAGLSAQSIDSHRLRYGLWLRGMIGG
jgi:hypothetical protein